MRPSYSHEEAIAAAKKWMIENYRQPKLLRGEESDRWHERFGMLVDFLWALHPPATSPNHEVSDDR